MRGTNLRQHGKLQNMLCALKTVQARDTSNDGLILSFSSPYLLSSFFGNPKA